MERKIIFKEIIKGVGIAYLISIILILIYAIILAYTNVAESTMPTCIFVISMFSVFIASSFVAIKIKENGLKNGGLVGLIYIALLYILSSFTEGMFALTGYATATIIFNILLGMVGGIIGVNLSK